MNCKAQEGSGRKVKEIKTKMEGTSLVVQWLRIFLPKQGMWVLYLVREPRFHMPWSK